MIEAIERKFYVASLLCCCEKSGLLEKIWIGWPANQTKKHTNGFGCNPVNPTTQTTKQTRPTNQTQCGGRTPPTPNTRFKHTPPQLPLPPPRTLAPDKEEIQVVKLVPPP
jgi:hypothetical protein